MEGNMPQGSMVPSGPSYGALDLQRSMQIHHQGPPPQALHHSDSHQTPFEGSPQTMNTLQSCDQTIPMRDLNKGDKGRNSASDEDNRSLMEYGTDNNNNNNNNNNDVNKGKKGYPWQRVKWTDKMVRLLITAVSYIGEDVVSDCEDWGRRKFAVLQKKGKWKSVSKVLAERCYNVSPQQCEDKFNDLNKRYKKLNDMLGRGTSCQVVENPALLDVIDFLTQKEKDDVRKILSSKHLFYEEMCSYHNRNRLHLPHDPELQCSLWQALRSRDNHENNELKRNHHDDLDEDEPDLENNDQDDDGENCTMHGLWTRAHGTAKRIKQGLVYEDVTHGASFSNPRECNKGSHSFMQPNMNQGISGNARATWLHKLWMESWLVQLEEQKLQIQLEMLELEKQKSKWEIFCRREDRELEMMRVENERMKLENKQLALELKRTELGLD